MPLSTFFTRTTLHKSCPSLRMVGVRLKTTVSLTPHTTYHLLNHKEKGLHHFHRNKLFACPPYFVFPSRGGFQLMQKIYFGAHHFSTMLLDYFHKPGFAFGASMGTGKRTSHLMRWEEGWICFFVSVLWQKNAGAGTNVLQSSVKIISYFVFISCVKISIPCYQKKKCKLSPLSRECDHK